MNSPLISRLVKFKQKVMRVLLGANRDESLSLSEQIQVIEALPEPPDLIERSYYQYLCQKKRHSALAYRIFVTGANIIAIIPLLYYSFLKRSTNEPANQSESSTAVFLGVPAVKDRIPESLIKEYGKLIIEGEFGLSVTRFEKIFIRRIWARHPLNVLFVLKCAMKIAAYRDVIDSVGANAIIATSEDSYTSSVLTEYCRRRHVKHINMMHGEVVYNLSRTFFAFDACYVWDQHYSNLMTRLRAEPTQFIIELPKGLIYQEASSVRANGATYYLQNQDIRQMLQIKELLESLQIDYRVRPHHIWTEMDELRRVFEASHIEDAHDVPIEESILKSEVLISWCSTVLFQGYVNEKRTVVDNVSNPVLIERMKDSDYIMLAEGRSELLSNVLHELGTIV